MSNRRDAGVSPIPAVAVANWPIPLGRVLLFAFAFPPLRLPMSACVAKTMAAFRAQGFAVDVLTGVPFSREIPIDNSLNAYVDAHFERVIRVAPAKNIVTWLRLKSRLARIPDLMHALSKPTYETLLDMDLSAYDAVVTWSPFHSINPIMARVKAARPTVRWIAQFGDPWRNNPLETVRSVKLWNWFHEATSLSKIDHLVHSSPDALALMLTTARRTDLASSVLPHSFDPALFPERPRHTGDRITLRYVGQFFGRRRPDAVFAALATLLHRRPELVERIAVELVGTMPDEVLRSPEALSLPPGLVTRVEPVDYVSSLELMYDADILLLIEPDLRQNLFVPGKVSDYVGTGRPIVALCPPGASRGLFQSLGFYVSSPNDQASIVQQLETAIDCVESGEEAKIVPARASRDRLLNREVARGFIDIIRSL
jgi:glycosyltransferase involved in cell wall biosynthesis